jgi:hypothetical protein
MQVIRLEEWDCFSIQIVHQTISAGLSDTSEPLITAEMCLEGTVVDTRFEQPRANVTVRVDVEFAEEQRYDDEGYEAGDEDHPDGIPEGYDLGASYIGHIRVLLPSGARTDVHMKVVLFLPMKLFSLLMLMKDMRIRLSTVHDSIAAPKVELNSYIAGYIKRVTWSPAPLEDS